MVNGFSNIIDNVQEKIVLDDSYIIIESPDLRGLVGESFKAEMNYIIYCHKGELNISVDMVDVTIQMGEVTYLMNGQAYEIYSASDDFMATVLVLSDSFLDWMNLNEYLYFRNNRWKIIQHTSYGSFMRYIQTCKDIIRLDPSPEKKEIIYLLTKAYILGISHFEHKVNSDKYKNDASHAIAQRFFVLLRMEGKYNRSLKFFADTINISLKHLSFAVRKSTGFSAFYWVNRRTIIESKILLSSTDKSMSDMADLFGFSNQSVFGRFFKQQTGISPTQYRKEHYSKWLG